MKNFGLRNLVWMMVIIALIGSCGICEELTTTDLPEQQQQQQQPKEFSSEQIKMMDYLEAKKIDFPMLESAFSKEDPLCNDVCCDTLLFCGVTKDDVMPFIERYRNEDWHNTSDFFQIHDPSDVDPIMRKITNQTWPVSPDPLSIVSNFDARFMDIPIDELENYLCYIRNNPDISKANICRFYYLKYDSSDKVYDSDYHNKHTLAIVPTRVERDGAGVITSTIEYTDTVNGILLNSIYTIGLKECKKSPMANHNRLCPPFRDCGESTMIFEVDSN